ncbi:hypothetical protein ACOI1H_16270 [Loktanella sp. DJP18]|uniref:hypothetical protein n=1 Tax=Loktanella sp. DJP18 TaxID=3409788 RepID=UPI003BB73FF6
MNKTSETSTAQRPITVSELARVIALCAVATCNSLSFFVAMIAHLLGHDGVAGLALKSFGVSTLGLITLGAAHYWTMGLLPISNADQRIDK